MSSFGFSTRVQELANAVAASAAAAVVVVVVDSVV